MSQLNYYYKMIGIFSLVCILTVAFAFAHPFYLSVTDLKYNASEKALQGTVKIFTNDLEEALRKVKKQPVDLINYTNKEETAKLLREYLALNLVLTVNHSAISYELLDFEHESEAVWLYLEAKNCPPLKTLEISNSILYDCRKSQSNIVHIEQGGNRQSAKVSAPESHLSFKF